MKRINLLPPDIAQRRRARQQTSLLALVGVLIVVLLGVVWVLRQAQLNSEEDRRALAEAQVRTLEARRNALKEFADLEQTVVQKEQTLTAVMAGDVGWSRILTELAMVIPEESWLTAFSGTAAEPASARTPAPVTAAPTLGTLTFSAVTFELPDVAKWIIRLQGMKSLQNIWVPSAARGEIGAREVVNFSSTADLSQAAESGRYKGAAR